MTIKGKIRTMNGEIISILKHEMMTVIRDGFERARSQAWPGPAQARVRPNSNQQDNFILIDYLSEMDG